MDEAKAQRLKEVEAEVRKKHGPPPCENLSFPGGIMNRWAADSDIAHNLFVEEQIRKACEILGDSIRCNVLVLGDSKVGKTSLKNGINFSNAEYQVITVGEQLVQLKYDFDQPTGRRCSSKDYSDANIIFMVYDMSNPESFLNINKNWIPEIRKIAPPRPELVLIGNKLDVATSMRKVKTKSAQDLADGIGAEFIEVSAKSGENVDSAFRIGVEAFLRNRA